MKDQGGDWLPALTQLYGWRVDRGAELVSRLRVTAKAHGVPLAGLAGKALRREGDAQAQLATLGAVGETYFFRMPETLMAAISLVSAMAGDRVLEVWSAGCASGEEAYTAAMMVTKICGPDRANVLGTDLNPKAISRARAGRYGKWSFRGAKSHHAVRYLTPAANGELVVPPKLKSQVHFQILNLMEKIYPTSSHGTKGFDLIFCRNVLVYFEPALADLVLARLAERLSPTGILVTGPLDMREHVPELERIRGQPEGLYARTDGALKASLGPSNKGPLRLPLPSGPSPSAPRPSSPRASSPPPPLRPGVDSPAPVSVERVPATVAALPTSQRELQLEGMIALEQGEMEPAKQAFEAALAAEKKLPLANLGMALCFQALGNDRSARESAQKALALLEGQPEGNPVTTFDDKLTVGIVRRLAADIVENR